MEHDTAYHILAIIGILTLAALLGGRLRASFNQRDTIFNLYLFIISFVTILGLYSLLLLSLTPAHVPAISLAFIVVGLVLSGWHWWPRRKSLHVSYFFDWFRSWREADRISVAVVTASVTILGVAFLLHQSLAYPKGWDASFHFVYIESFLTLDSLPQHELGFLTPPFYQRGYHASVAALAILGGGAGDVTFRAFNLFLFATIPLGVWFFTYSVSRSSRAALLATVSSLVLVSLFLTRGNYPMLLSLHLMTFGLGTVLYLLGGKKSPRWPLLLIMPLLGLEIVATHPVVAQVFLAFAGGILLFLLINGIRRGQVPVVLLPLYAIGVGGLLYVLMFPDLAAGQILFVQGKFSNAPSGDPFASSVTRTAVEEAVLLFFPLALLPPALLGLVHAIRRHLIPVVAVVSVALTLSFIQLLPLSAREPYVLLLPLTLLSGLGLARILRGKEGGPTSRRLLAMFLAIFLVFSGASLVYVALNPKASAWPYLGEGESEFAMLLDQQGVEGMVFASFNHPGMIRVGVLSGNQILVGDGRYFTPISYQEVFEFLTETDCDRINATAAEFQFDGVLLRRAMRSTPEVLDNFMGCLPGGNLIEVTGIVLYMWNVGP